jgi:tetratricopeptide (TPR) repeat protein
MPASFASASAKTVPRLSIPGKLASLGRLAFGLALAAATPRAALAAPSSATAETWYDQLPPATTVTALYGTRDGQVTATSRAACAVLADFIETWVGVNQQLPLYGVAAQLPPQARTRWQDYATRAHRTTFPPSDPAAQVFANPAFRDSVLNRFVPRPILTAATITQQRRAAAPPLSVPASPTAIPAPPATPQGTASSSGGNRGPDPEQLRQMSQLIVEGESLVDKLQAINDNARLPQPPSTETPPASRGARSAAEAWLDRGVEHLKKRELGRAIEAFKKALALDDSMWSALAGLGAAYYYQKDYRRSLEAHQELLRRRPDNTQAKNGMAMAYFGMGRFHQAAVNLKDVLAADPEDAHSWSLYGRCLLQLDEDEAALAALKKSVSLSPRSANLRFWLATGLSMAGELGEALDVCRSIRELDKESARACTEVVRPARPRGR